MLFISGPSRPQHVEFIVQADHRSKMIENKKIHILLRFCQRPENTFEHEINGDTNFDTKGLENRLQELEISCKIMTIQTTILLKSARILDRVLEISEDLRGVLVV